MNRLCLMLMIPVLATAVAQANWTFRDVSERLTSTVPDVEAVAWGDVDNDGDPDLFIGGDGTSRGVLYENDQGALTDRTLSYGFATLNTFNVYGAQFVDFDQDGYLDLFLLTNDNRGFNLLRQLPNHRFQTVENGTDIAFNDPVSSANWFDVDGDNALDLILSSGATHVSAPMVIMNQSQELVAIRDAGFMQYVSGAGAIAVEDFDRDGDADIFVGSNGNENCPARLFCNTRSGFVDYAPAFNIPRKTGLTGAVWFDNNNDQQLDLFSMGNEEYTCLLKGKEVNGVRGLVRVPCPALIAAAHNARYVHAVDANMDGWTDLFFVKEGNPGWALLKNERGENWSDVTNSVGLEVPYAVSSGAWADWDGDGDLDLVAAHGADGVRLYANDTENRHEYIILNLLSSATHIPLRNCSVWMRFETAKAVGSTYLRTASMGCDAVSVLLVNSSDYKSGEVQLQVGWPNGQRSVYTLNDLTLNTTNYLVEPDETPGYPVAAVRSPESVRLTISPNPFNPTTLLTYTLSEAADVRLQVFNLMGQEVATPVSSPQAAGTHQVAFDGAALPTGLYLARLTVGSESQICRLLLAK